MAYYSHVKPEAPMEIAESKPAPGWPTAGRISFDNVFLRYHEHGVDVLKDISFTIEPKEKIGIVGRTGSGKVNL